MYYSSMREKLNQATQEAIEAGLASMQKMADETGVHQVTVNRWHTGAANVGPESAAKLARVLKGRAVKLLEAAARLEALAETEGGDDV